MTAPSTLANAHSYSVQGMTCGHCATSVQEEVSRLRGVQDVRVDLASGQVLVTGPDIRDDAVAAAVAEAGYKVVS